MSDQFQGWLTTDEVAAYLRCNAQSARKLLASGAIESRKFGQTYRTKAQWCDEYMEGLAA